MNPFLNSVLDFFIPRVCVSCDMKLTLEEFSICENCFQKIKNANSQFIRQEFLRKFEEDKIIKDFLSLFIFSEDSPIRDLLHVLKYEKKFRLGNFLGKLLAANFDEQIKKWDIDFVIPIPLHKLKMAERGYNQSYYISKGLANCISKKVNTKIVKRNRFTSTQTKLNLAARKENIKDAFSITNKKRIKDKNILLLDDVITTGATITECGKLLKQNGANNIYAVSVCLAE